MTLLLLSATILLTQDTSRLIEDLGVESPGNSVTNTAAGKLVVMGDQAVNSLEGALRHSNPRVRYYAVRCLGEIDTTKSFNVLIHAANAGDAELAKNATYALTWHPKVEAKQVYLKALDNLEGLTYAVSVIKALEDLKCREAVTRLASLQETQTWTVSYAALRARRSISGTQTELNSASDVMRKAKFQWVDKKELGKAVDTLRAAGGESCVDLLDVYFSSAKAAETHSEPSALLLIQEKGKSMLPVMRRALNDKSDDNVKWKVKQLIETLGWQKDFQDKIS